MSSKRISKKAAGRRLNKEGRLTPVDALQQQLEHWHKLMTEEIEKPPKHSDATLIATYAARAQKCAEILAPYRHARLSPIDENGSSEKKFVIRVLRQSESLEEWQRQYCQTDPIATAITDQQTSDKADALMQRARGGVPIEMPDVRKSELN